MAKFVYRMQNILELKEKLESQEKIAYSMANARVLEEEEKLETLLKRRGAYDIRLREAGEGRLDLREIAHLRTAIETMKLLIRDQMFALKRARDALEIARRRLNQAIQERKTHEKLRENAFEVFKKEVAAEEIKVNDDLTSFRYGIGVKKNG